MIGEFSVDISAQSLPVPQRSNMTSYVFDEAQAVFYSVTYGPQQPGLGHEHSLPAGPSLKLIAVGPLGGRAIAGKSFFVCFFAFASELVWVGSDAVKLDVSVRPRECEACQPSCAAVAAYLLIGRYAIKYQSMAMRPASDSPPQ